MRKHIYITIILLFQISLGQSNHTTSYVQNNTKGEEIINNYLKVIGGKRKLKKIQTIEKRSKVELINSPDIGMKAQ